MKGRMTVSHAKFQYYRHHYCLVCMTGLLGCRWHRYQQSTRDNRKRDIFWFSLFTLTFLYIVFYFYFWLIADNDYNNLEWYMFDNTKIWVPWYRIILPLTCAAFGYFLLVMLLYLCHVGHGHQIFIHPVHMVLIVFSLGACVAMTVVIDDLWHSQFHVIYLSLQMMGPFLHIGIVTILSAMMWFISHSWYKLSRKLHQLLLLLVIITVMLGLYISPQFIFCPCITSSRMPPKPKLFSHRGAEGIAPENTLIAFHKALTYDAFGFESDVRISYDGVPFMYHDDTFQRTTNIKEVFPDQVKKDVSLFNMSDIQTLDAGSWFLETDPFGTASDLSEADRMLYRKQKIPTLSQVLQIVANTSRAFMFDVRDPVYDHPFFENFTKLVNQTLIDSGINMSKLYWLTDGSGWSPPGAYRTYPGAPSIATLQQHSIYSINAEYDNVNSDLIHLYQAHNVSSNIYVLDASWFFSYFWCLGVTSVCTRRIDQLSEMQRPVWTMTPKSYFILWVSVDVLSAIVIIVIFIVQRIRMFGTSFSPESISLTSARRARTYRSRAMKEKLLRDGIIDPMDDPEGQGSGVINHPVAYSMSSLPASFAGPSNVRVGPIPPPDQKYELD